MLTPPGSSRRMPGGAHVVGHEARQDAEFGASGSGGASAVTRFLKRHTFGFGW